VATQAAGATLTSATTSLTYLQHLQTSALPPTYADTTIGQGWQPTPTTFGSSEPIGTNISGPPNVTFGATGFPASVSVAVVPSSTTTTRVGVPSTTSTSYAAAIVGAVNSTLQNTIQTSVMGGFDWNSTASTVISNTGGIERITTCDSFSNTGTTQITWSGPGTTSSVLPGDGMAAESVPMVATNSSMDTPINFINYPAYPVSS